ncbi:ABC-2 family transporter protein [Aquisphaera giovannonii]|uniref:ABC-2 family transporter protein n=1 Tax=Aquisphaera giovannonii TaxID=406548 RepID=A0A5B9VUI3_9BACT|nr:ABC transporter permease subunit [Aquisphaera giovannonii]QEH32043.1 ABC-2 family transporter protein [Aquisphaera giovannonii]
MIPGPVFTFELLRTSRRGSFYVMRAAYAAILLWAFYTVYQTWVTWGGDEPPMTAMKALAISSFGAVAVSQVAFILAITPALVAGVIAEEKQRKTLHYLLASRLSGPEIVLGKLLARMLHAAVLLAVGFPVLSLLVLLGGIDPRLIGLACAAAASTAWLLAAMSIWASTLARRPREALMAAYGIEFLWLFVPAMVGMVPSTGWFALDGLLDGVLDILRQSSPVGMAYRTFSAVLMGGGLRVEDLVAMIAYQAVAGAVFAVAAACQLRAVFRRQEGRAGREAGPRRRWAARLGMRPSLGDRPMLWKELFTARPRGFARIIGGLVTLAAGGAFLYYAVGYGWDAFREMRDHAYARSADPWDDANVARWKFHFFLKYTLPFLYIPALLGLAGAAASAITSEHEADTWVSLTATDLTAGEILLAKWLGALRRPWRIVAVIVLSTVAGVLVGSVHPLSLPVQLACLASHGAFAATLGLWISLHLRSTWRAQFLTVSVLLLVNLLGQAALNLHHYPIPMIWPGFAPYDLSKSILSPRFPDALKAEAADWKYRSWDIDDGFLWTATFLALGLAVYAAATIGLGKLCLLKFDDVAGRARRPAGRTGQTTNTDHRN